MTNQERRIQAWAQRLGMDAPPSDIPTPDSDGFIRTTCYKFGLGGAVTEDDRALIAEKTTVTPKQPYPWAVTASKDGLSWNFAISLDNYLKNLDTQRRLAVDQTRPTKNEIVKPGEEGYYDEPSTFEPKVPVSVDAVLRRGPENVSGYKQQVAIADSQGDFVD